MYVLMWVPQVVDNNWGVHGIIPKSIFAKRTVGRKLMEYLGDRDLLDQIAMRHKIQERKASSIWSMLR